MFTVLSALAFSLAVCAVIGVGFTTIVNRVVEVLRDLRARSGIAGAKQSTES